MGNRNCYVCGKKIENDEKLDDTLVLEVEGKNGAHNDKDAGEVLLCAECEKKLREETEKMKGKK